jgi:serine O-acetyltransferase
MINAIYFYRVERWLYLHKVPLLPILIKGLIFLIYNSSIPYQCDIGKGTRFSYGGISVVVHKRAVIGDNCIIGSCVTLGGKSGMKKVPVVGNNVNISTGSKLLGEITIGNNVIIGANAVVLKNVPDNVVVAGIPAKVIKNL